MINKEDTRKYPFQQCQDDKVNTAFRNLHKHLINEVIEFCNAYGITIDEFHMNANDLRGSIECGEWEACTDSSLVFNKDTDEWKDIKDMKKTISSEEYKKVKLEQEPFMYSM